MTLLITKRYKIMNGLSETGLYGGDCLAELIHSNQIAAGHAGLAGDICRSGADGVRETAAVGRALTDSVRDSIVAAHNDASTNLQSTERNGGETRLTASQNVNAVQDSIARTSAAAARDSSALQVALCESRLEVSKGFGDTRLTMSEQHCEIKLEAARHASELAKQIAECCCDMKMENARTRDLIQAQALADSHRREGDMQNRINILELSKKV